MADAWISLACYQTDKLFSGQGTLSENSMTSSDQHIHRCMFGLPMNPHAHTHKDVHQRAEGLNLNKSSRWFIVPTPSCSYVWLLLLGPNLAQETKPDWQFTATSVLYWLVRSHVVSLNTQNDPRPGVQRLFGSGWV